MAGATIGETYFFRDHGQFDLLRLRLLPELLERHRDTKCLRLWSAGCASGEEPYSLAILLDQLLPEPDDWEVLILGSDIDQAALAKARRGRYGSWSFRLMPETIWQRYFRRLGADWELDERIRRRVTFRGDDLLREGEVVQDPREMDLILCRNVFIYLTPEEVARVAKKLTGALREGGYLMTGHTELSGQIVANLQHRLFPESVVYQRHDFVSVQGAAPSPTQSVTAPIPAPLVGPAPVPLPEKEFPQEQLLASARGLADRGAYTQAEEACHGILATNPLAAGPYFLLAQLAQLKGDFTLARDLLHKTLYLDPGSVAAHLELAALCERAGEFPRSRALRNAALNILRVLPPDQAVEPYETTVLELSQWLGR